MALRDLVPWRKKREDDEESLAPSERQARDMFRDFFEEAFTPWALTRMRPWAAPEQFSPDVDVAEDEKEYRVTAELPGLSRDDIDVSLAEGVLTIRGQKKEEEEERRGDYVRIERSYGSFVRRVPLPTEVDEDAVEAQFKDGVLRLTLPKSEKQRGRKIEIGSGEESEASS